MKINIHTLIDQLSIEFEDTIDQKLLPETSFKQLEGWDSMNALILIALVDEHYDFILSPQDLQKCQTVKDLHTLLENKTN